jgi:hypothetical protein
MLYIINFIHFFTKKIRLTLIEKSKTISDTENMFEQFVFFIMPFLIIFFGLIGNLLGLLTLRKRKQENSQIGPIQMYRFLFITDSINLISFIGYSMGIYLYSSFSCKFLFYLSVLFYSLSSLILIYILIENYLSIKYPVESNLLRKNKPQFIYTVIVFIINLIYFLPVFLNLNIIELESTISNNNITKSRLTCDIESNKNEISILAFINRILLPLILIIFFSTILILKILTSRERMNTFYSNRERKRFYKDVHLSIISILFNLIQYSFNIPFIFVIFINNDIQSPIFFFCLNIFGLSYFFNFYFLLLVNSLFRKDFYLLFTNKSQTAILNIEMEVFYQRN